MRKTLTSLALSSFLLASCTTNAPYREHTPSEKKWLAAVVACQVADLYTTKRAFDRGLRELNPLYGNHIGRVAVGKILTIGGLYFAGKVDPKHRKLYYQIGSVLGCGAAIWNTRQTIKHGN